MILVETRGRKSKLSSEQQKEVLNSRKAIKELAVLYDISQSSLYQLHRKRRRKFNPKTMNPILDSALIMDNVSEALYEVIGEGTNRFSMLIAEAIDQEGEKYQIQIVVTRAPDDQIENDEGMPIFGIKEECGIFTLIKNE